MCRDKEFEKELLNAFEDIRASEKEMDELNDEELKEARKRIKDIWESKNVFLNEWINTDLKRYGRLTKHDLLRILIAVRLKVLADALKELEEEGELWEVHQLDWQNLRVAYY